MPTARRSARNSKRRPSSSRKSRPPPSMEFSTSVSSVSSEPTPILESSLASSYQKHVLRRHQPTSRTSRRPGPRDSPFTPRRPVGAVPELFVTFRHVSLAVDIPVSPAAAAAAAQAASGQMGRETLAAKQLPTISNHVRGIAAGLTASKTFVRRQILKNVTAAFTPGSMTLLLGRSGSGKSVLLKLLGGRLDVRANGVTTDGEVSYNGLTRQELKQQLPQCVAYVPQQDTHLPVMTVKETLDFAFECCAINAGARPVGSVSKSPSLEHPLALPTTYLGGERDPVTVTRELGLTRCQGTIVGDERLRGVSGGEKKRVTTGEMAFGPHAVSLMDEITTGLDSSAAFDVVNAQRRLARQQRQTVVISLQQPAPEVLALFDNVLLLADGEVLYHGPRAHIQAYFEALGFVCPPERGLADFLCDLASPQQLQYERSHAPMPGRRRHPRSANEFADLWIMSPIMLLSYVMLEYRRHESSPALPPPLPASYSDTIPTPRQPKESYAMLSTPHGEDDELLESDITGFLPPDGRILGANGDSSDSFNASQGVHTDPGDIMVRLMPRWEVPPVTLAFQDLRYSITVPADAVSEGQSGVEGAPGRPVSVDSRAKAGKSKEMVTRELLKGVTGYALPGTMTALMGSTGAGMFMPSDRVSPVTFAQRRAASDGLQFAMLLRRFTRLYWRTPFYTFTRMVTAFTLGLMFGLVYSGSNDFTSYQGANGAVGLIFFSTCFLGVGAYVHVLPLAFEERGPFYRERASETYSALWYFAASSVVEIPCAALASLIFVGVFYPMAGFSAHGDFAQVVVYWLVLTVHILFQTYFGQFFTFAMPSIELAAVWGSLFDSIFLMFMGYNPPVSSIPDGYKWLFQIVPHRYTFEVLTALVLGDCPDAQLQQIQDAAASNTTIDVSQWPLGCQPLTDAPPAVANIPLTSYIDAVFGARREDTARSVAVVVGVLLAMRAATLIVMRVVNHQKR
ncbi:hypothetical protein PR002_g6386 [Phytophthora rubi]|uniref:ABC transporter domain-containing protein n=1 Tax=Phytophthora rubi TaxID=129364 RepID=A0A6A3N304_9STRA|nr:hypothetical protein PR002_g6386 [Phytophthora rubi]